MESIRVVFILFVFCRNFWRKRSSFYCDRNFRNCPFNNQRWNGAVIGSSWPLFVWRFSYFLVKTKLHLLGLFVCLSSKHCFRLRRRRYYSDFKCMFFNRIVSTSWNSRKWNEKERKKTTENYQKVIRRNRLANVSRSNKWNEIMQHFFDSAAADVWVLILPESPSVAARFRSRFLVLHFMPFLRL